MVEEYLARKAPKSAQPFQDLAFAGMSGECVHRFDPCPYIELVVHYLHAFYAVKHPSTEGSLCLIADA